MSGSFVNTDKTIYRSVYKRFRVSVVSVTEKCYARAKHGPLQAFAAPLRATCKGTIETVNYKGAC